MINLCPISTIDIDFLRKYLASTIAVTFNSKNVARSDYIYINYICICIGKERKVHTIVGPMRLLPPIKLQ
jgi:hypothetical protein